MTASFPAFDDGVTFEGKALFVAGERSKFTSRDDEPLIRKHFPNAKFVWIPEGGHWVMNDKVCIYLILGLACWLTLQLPGL